MSWLARSIANTLHLDDEEEEEADEEAPDDAVPRSTHNDAVSPEDLPLDTTLDHRLSDSNGGAEDLESDNNNQGRGVKEDLSEIRDSFTRQLWGVASFLAPPPPPPPPPLHQRSDSLHLESKSDGAESSNEDEDEDEELMEYDARESGELVQPEDYYTSIVEDAIGITEEVLAFARNIAHHPETWLDFTLTEDEEFDDFDISDAQYKHALAVEHLAPRLAALRIELCPAHMTEGYFWMVYFVLLHPRLNKHDADQLSSPQIVEARTMWMQELQKRTKEESYWHNKDSSDSPLGNFTIHPYEDDHIGNVSHRISPFESTMHHTDADHVIEKHVSNEIEFIDKSVIKEDPAPNHQEKVVVSSFIGIPKQDIDDDDEDDDDWVKDDSDLIGYCSTSIFGNEEDISFSDLEDDIDCSIPVKSKIVFTEWNTTNRTS
ncbi:hypothetical protein BUALT_Bualt08G0045200 [Buddleja alternifolia]|uniref:BSD domain-containing protein n=1 Tax=Buddleja alternifolia TaxID=168488 RepID=A0AAV6XBN2_9LAMI|nr:hypothetical protein BUALT_Bualt08G0045200 [Buddleja alternifolia]